MEELPAPLPPREQEAPRFSATGAELWAAAASFVLGYLYLDGLFDSRLWLCVFALGFLALTEFLNRGKPRAWECWFYLGCFLAVLLGLLLEREAVWGRGWSFFFLHLVAVWYAYTRACLPCEGKTGKYLPLDAVFAFVVTPFKHFFLRLRCLWFGLTRLRGEKKTRWDRVGWSLAAAFVLILLFSKALSLLLGADAGFERMLRSFVSRLHWDLELDPLTVLNLVLSLPVGAYLFGLLAGGAREDGALGRSAAESIERGLPQLRKVPEKLLLALLGAFVLLYAVFFAVQARYLFGAFTRTLPQGFIVSQYAREGFFELCKLMAVNFALLYLLSRFSERPLRESRAGTVLALVLLAESLLFSVVAFSKLALYISCFGFTPKRLESSWLVCVLFFGCLCAGYTLLSGKKSFGVWALSAAGSLCLLCLV